VLLQEHAANFDGNLWALGLILFRYLFHVAVGAGAQDGAVACRVPDCLPGLKARVAPACPTRPRRLTRGSDLPCPARGLRASARIARSAGFHVAVVGAQVPGSPFARASAKPQRLLPGEVHPAGASSHFGFDKPEHMC
jgi:hypothetical protein